MAQLPDGYITLEDANTYLGYVEPWGLTGSVDKTTALSQGRIYLDANYLCDSDSISDSDGLASNNIQLANAELANLYLANPTTFFNIDAKANRNVTKNRVKAGDVESEKTYSSAGIGYIDPYPYVSMLLSGECTLSSSSIQVDIARQ